MHASAHTCPESASSTPTPTPLTVLALAQFLVVLGASIVNIHLPSLGRQLGLETTALSWITTAYVLCPSESRGDYRRVVELQGGRPATGLCLLSKV